MPASRHLRCHPNSEPVPPEPHRLVTDVDAALQVLDVAQGKRTYIMTIRRITSGVLSKLTGHFAHPNPTPCWPAHSG